MKKFKVFFIVVCMSILTSPAFAQILGETPPFALSVDQMKTWTNASPNCDPANVSTVPLAPRFTQTVSQIDPSRNSDMKVLYCPDGINNKGNYTVEQSQFNLFNFTHWQYIDVMNWFGGTASLNIMIPSKPWIEAAHRNGVKILGTVFFAPSAWGGSSATVDNFLEKSGNQFIAVTKLKEIANYYGFDGWLINEETSVSSTTASNMLAFIKQYQAQKSASTEIIWYDSMTTSGNVSWQNQFNSTNSPFVQDGSTKSSDGIFINYNWNSTMASNSASRATTIGRSPYDVYMGADLWPDRNAQPVFSNNGWMDDLHNGSTPKTSVALFATNFTYDKFNTFSTDPTKVQDFYDTEVHFFAGDDRDINATDASGWKGIGHYIPARSVINNLPFETNFNTGHGRLFANDGVETTKDWHDMAKQEILPSWQWAMSGNSNVTALYDFTTAYAGGNSVKISGNITANQTNTLKLYKTKIAVAADSKIDLTYKTPAAGNTNAKLFVAFSDAPSSLFSYDIGSTTDSNWANNTFNLGSHNGKELVLIGLQFSSTSTVSNYAFNLGKIKVYNATGGSNTPVITYTADKTTVLEGESITYTNTTTNATSWSWTFAGGTPSTSTAQNPVVQYNNEGIYAVSLTATGSEGSSSLTKTSYITVNSTDIDFTDPAGTGTITARAEISTAENRFKAFDKLYTSSNGTKWLDNGGTPTVSKPSWIQIELPVAKAADKLVITSANDESGRDPKDFSLKASNDGTNYITLASWTNQLYSSRYQEKAWTFSNNTAYTYYKLEISKNNGNVSMTQLSEIKIIGPSVVSYVPVSQFSTNVQTINEGQTVNFTDQSTNTPTSWAWTFAGGTPSSSTEQNPSVTYNTAGTYDVSLIATNADGDDTKIKTAYITVNSNNPEYCTSQSNNITYEWISGVTIGAFNKTSGADNYSDFTNTTIDLGYGDHNITLTPEFSSSTYQEYWKIWIDFNKDGDFEDAGEELFTGSNNAAISGTLTIPQSATGSTRMRVKMDYNNTSTPCGSFSYGEVEDYTVNFTETAVRSLKTSLAENTRTLEIKDAVSFKLYPNPVKRYLTIEGELENFHTISFFNMLGQLIKTENINERYIYTANLTDLHKGSYIIKLHGDKPVSFKIIKK